MIGAFLMFLAGRRPLNSPAPSLGIRAALAALEAEDFVERDVAPAFERFGLLAMSVDAAGERRGEDLAAIEAIEAVPRPHGRGHGLEWAYEQAFVEADRLRQAAQLMRVLERYEPEIRALIAADEAWS